MTHTVSVAKHLKVLQEYACPHLTGRAWKAGRAASASASSSAVDLTFPGRARASISNLGACQCAVGCLSLVLQALCSRSGLPYQEKWRMPMWQSSTEQSFLSWVSKLFITACSNVRTKNLSPDFLIPCSVYGPPWPR